MLPLIPPILDQLKGFISEVSSFSDSDEEYSQYHALIQSSLIKSYEFTRFVYLEDDFDNHFFVTSFLRGIAEDIVILRSIQALPVDKRERLLRGIQAIEVNDRILKQWDFFRKYRPFQPVIDTINNIEGSTADVQAIWREMGWTKFKVQHNNLMPPVRQLARKFAPGILGILYEFIYRLSSSTVYFSPQTLLRMGWGNIDEQNNISGTISISHMKDYHKIFCQVYGALLFTFYFEFFPQEIGMSTTEELLIKDIRRALLSELRWPEMITFEEMNLPVPKAYHDKPWAYGTTIHQAVIEILQTGFTSQNWEKLQGTIKNK